MIIIDEYSFSNGRSENIKDKTSSKSHSSSKSSSKDVIKSFINNHDEFKNDCSATNECKSQLVVKS